MNPWNIKHEKLTESSSQTAGNEENFSCTLTMLKSGAGTNVKSLQDSVVRSAYEFNVGNCSRALLWPYGWTATEFSVQVSKS